MFDHALAALPALGQGIWVTIQLTVISLALGTGFGVVLALMRASRYRVIAWPALAWATYFRGTPLLVQLFLIYYGAGQFQKELQAVGLWSWFRSPWFCAILGLALNNAAYVSEIVYGGLKAVPKGALEAAKALALPAWPVFWHVITPSVLRSAWPAYSNEAVFQLQATSLVALLTIMDITGVARQHAARSFAFFEIYLSSAVCYLVLVAALLLILRYFEHQLRRRG